jgi:hypothetical protein
MGYPSHKQGTALELERSALLLHRFAAVLPACEPRQPAIHLIDKEAAGPIERDDERLSSIASRHASDDRRVHLGGRTLAEKYSVRCRESADC